MSAALVRKALEVSEESSSVLKSLKNSGKKKLKGIEKRKKSQLSPQEVLRRNLKILKALEFSSRAKKYGKISIKPSPPAAPEVTPTPESTKISKKLKKKNKKDKKNLQTTSTSFTEEDFKQFEAEYFVTD